MDSADLHVKCQIYLEKGQKQWDSYFSKWDKLAENEIGVDEDQLIDSEDEYHSIKPRQAIKKINKKASVVQKIKKKCMLTLNKKFKKNKENFNVREESTALKIFNPQVKKIEDNKTNLNYECINNENEREDSRLTFLETLMTCANKSGLFGILSKTFSYQIKMTDVASGFDKFGIVPQSVNSITTNVTFNITSNISSPLLMNKTENAIMNFSPPIIENRLSRWTPESPIGSQLSLLGKTYGIENRQTTILNSNKPNFSTCETPRSSCLIPRNCFSENFQAKRKFSRLNLSSDEDERIKRFRSSNLDSEEKKTHLPAGPELIKSRDLISSIKKDFNLETPKSKKSLRFCSSENIGAKNKRKSRIKLLDDSDDDDGDESWSSKISLKKIFCTPKSNEKTENDGMENSDSDECEVIFETVKKK